MAEVVSGPAESPPPDPGARPRAGLVWAALAASLALTALFPVTTTVAALLEPPRGGSVATAWRVAWVEVAPAVVVSAVVVTWVFVFWSVVGSFLNVVVHRLPLGRSVARGGSSCPRCGRAIAWHDNLPVAGWLVLGGRCRSCGLPISPRYPIIEAVCAGLCTALFCRELPSDGVNIPLRPAGLWTGVNWIVSSLEPGLLGLYVWHCVALCTLLAWGLIVQDGHAVPVRAARNALAVAAIIAAACPQVHPVGIGFGPGSPADTAGEWLARGVVVSLVGAGAGSLGGVVLGMLVRLRSRGDAAGRRGLPLLPPRSLVPGLTLVGLVCGWQGLVGTVSVLLVACFAQVIVWSALRTWPAVAVELLLVPASFIQLCWWRQLGEEFGGWWPGPEAGWACLAIPTALAVVVWLALSAITPGAGAGPVASSP